MWRFQGVVWVMTALLALPGVALRADEPVGRTLSNEVIGLHGRHRATPSVFA